MASEFDIIRKYFSRPVHHTLLGVGDDAALIIPSAGTQLAVGTKFRLICRICSPKSSRELFRLLREITETPIAN